MKTPRYRTWADRWKMVAKRYRRLYKRSTNNLMQERQARWNAEKEMKRWQTAVVMISEQNARLFYSLDQIVKMCEELCSAFPEQSCDHALCKVGVQLVEKTEYYVPTDSFDIAGKLSMFFPDAENK